MTVFVSHSSKDRKVAETICTALEQRGVRCWIASRDIAAGENFQEAIVSAIRDARAMILVFSRNANDSPEIKKELALASEYRVVVIPARSEDYAPTGAFKYELATRQWIDLFADWEEAIGRLAEQVNRLAPAEGRPAMPPPPPKPAPKSRSMPIAAGALVVALLVAGGAWYLLNRQPPAPAVAVAPPTVPAAPQPVAPAPAPKVLALRAAPAVVTGEQLEVMLLRLGFHDARRNPAGKGPAHAYDVATVGDDAVLRDGATGLVWQHGGSKEGMDRAAADAYVAELNARKYAGFADWRLPTLEEAMSVMEGGPADPEKKAIRIAPQFRPGINFIWTADRAAAEGRGWVVYYYDAIAAPESFGLNAWVRAVRSDARG